MRATELNAKWKVGAKHALYIHDGHWYHLLTKFPGALFDKNGYVLFATEGQYRASTYLKIYNETNQVWIKPPGISAIPGYVRVENATGPETGFYAEELSDEGARRLRMHFESERKPQNAKAKKQSVLSLVCEICGFSFQAFYGPVAARYCEVHHLVPLKSLRRAAKVKLDDLAILCSNCHRVVHLRYPPYQLEEVRNMISQAGGKGN